MIAREQVSQLLNTRDQLDTVESLIRCAQSAAKNELAGADSEASNSVSTTLDVAMDRIAEVDHALEEVQRIA